MIIVEIDYLLMASNQSKLPTLWRFEFESEIEPVAERSQDLILWLLVISFVCCEVQLPSKIGATITDDSAAKVVHSIVPGVGWLKV